MSYPVDLYLISILRYRRAVGTKTPAAELHVIFEGTENNGLLTPTRLLTS